MHQKTRCPVVNQKKRGFASTSSTHLELFRTAWVEAPSILRGGGTADIDGADGVSLGRDVPQETSVAHGFGRRHLRGGAAARTGRRAMPAVHAGRWRAVHRYAVEHDSDGDLG